MDIDIREFWNDLDARRAAARKNRLPPREIMPQSERLLPGEMPQSEGERDEEEPDNPQQESTENTRLKVHRTGEETPEPSFKRRVLGRAKRVVGKISRLFRRRTPNEERVSKSVKPQRGRSRTRKNTRGLTLPPPSSIF